MSLKPSVATTKDSGNHYFNDYTTTTLYVELSFGFAANNIAFINDSDSDSVQISFDGSTQVYELASAEFKDLQTFGYTSVFVKATTGGEKVRISAT